MTQKVRLSISSFVAALILVISTSNISHASETWVDILGSGSGTVGYFHEIKNRNKPYAAVSLPGNPFKTCPGITGDCSAENISRLGYGGAFSPMPICAPNTQTYCVSGIFYKPKWAQDWIALTGKSIGTYTNSMKSESLNLPEGGQYSLWSDNSKNKHFTFSSQGFWGFRDGVMVPGSFSAEIYPTRVVSGQIGSSTKYWANYLWEDTNSYGQWVAPETDEELKIQLHIPTNFGKFATGRLELGHFSSEQLNDQFLNLEISGKNVEVPYVQVKASSFPGLIINPSNPGANLSYRWADVEKIVDPQWDSLVEISGDKSTGTQSRWEFSIYSRGKTFQPISTAADACVSKSNPFLGIVSTNAMHVGPTPPTYESGSINYQVTGLHFASSGKLEAGTVTYSLDKEVLKCMYKVKSLPVQAIISIISSNGEISTSTQTLRTVGKNFFITAKNINFSSPTIKLKFSTKKYLTITCVKGKTSRKIIDLAPKCPTGYKKK